jgi:aromatic ring-opening dioxygenase catalytic subunit (LigB family)
MPIVFSCTVCHAPGITAWPEAAPLAQKNRIYHAMDILRQRLAAAEVQKLILFTAEHWTNFFLDHISPFCVGRGDHFEGPVEPWLKIEATSVKGDPELATVLIEASYMAGIETGFSYELKFDHGTMVPLRFLTPEMNIPVVPIFVNTLAPPQPSPRRCFELGKIVGEIARNSPERIGIIATGGMSHDPGERNHGTIDEAFDRKFLDEMCRGDVGRLSAYTIANLASAGAGAIELLDWIALAGALGSFSGETLAYETVVPWASGVGVVSLEHIAA